MEHEEMAVKNDYIVKMQIGYLLVWSEVTAYTQEEAVEQAKDETQTSLDYGILNPPIDSDGKIEVLSVKIKKSE